MCIYSFPFLVVLQMVLMQMFHAAIYSSCVGTVTNTAGPSTQHKQMSQIRMITVKYVLIVNTFEKYKMYVIVYIYLSKFKNDTTTSRSCTL